MEKRFYNCSKVHFDFPYKESLVSKHDSTKPYYFQVLEDINNASPLEKEFLASQVTNIFKVCFPVVSNPESVISYYFSFTQAKSIFLIFAVDKSTNQIQGFHLSLMLEEFLEEGNSSEANTYIATKTLVGIRPEHRQGGFYRDLYTLYAFVTYRKFSKRNHIYFDLAINPISFYIVQKNTKWFYPFKIKEISRKQMELFLKLRRKFSFNPASETNPTLVKAMTKLTETEIQQLRNGYSKIPGEMKFFIDQTQLEKNVGVAFMGIANLVEGNTFGLPAGNYLEIPEFKLEVVEHSFLSPKL